MKKLCLGLGLLLLLWHGSALAQTGAEPSEAQRNEASAHFTRGVALYQEQAFRAALVEFERAYDIAPDHRLLYNIGQTKLRLQDYLGAVQSYETYLAEGGATVAPERRSQVESALTGLRERVGRLAITANRDAAEVFIDDVSIGKTPIQGTVPVNVGRHRVLVRAADGANESQLISVAGGDIAEVTLTFADTPRQVAVSAAPSDAPKHMSTMRIAAISSWAGGAALLAGATVTGVLAMNKQQDLDDQLKTQVDDARAVQNKRDRIDTYALTTDVLIGAGAAAVVVGTVLWIADARGRRNDKAAEAGRVKLRVEVGPRAALLVGSF